MTRPVPRTEIRRRYARFAAAILLAAAPAAHAGHAIEAGVGWQNTGALRDSLHWDPSIQGSRKDVPVFVGWTHLGQRRVYWAPLARLNYMNFWSLGGAGNTLGVTVAPAGVGVHLTRPLPVPGQGARRGRWLATLEVTLGTLQIGGNISPGAPTDPGVPDPDAHRAVLRADVAAGGVRPEHGFTQRYPLGDYAFATLGVPLHLRVARMVTERVGVGLFLEINPVLLEWTLSSATTAPSATPAYGYNVTMGLSSVVF